MNSNATSGSALATNPGKEGSLLLEAALLLVFCLLVGLASVGVLIWVVIFRDLFALDNLLLVLIDLVIGAVFMGNFFWAVHTGEARVALDFLLGRSKTKKEAAVPEAESKQATTSPESAA